MPDRALELHPDADAEAVEAADRYAAQSVSAAEGFLAELDHALEQVIEAPERWPRYLHGARRYVLRRFPFSVVYRSRSDVIEIVAVAHGKRRPGYWRHR